MQSKSWTHCVAGRIEEAPSRQTTRLLTQWTFHWSVWHWPGERGSSLPSWLALAASSLAAIQMDSCSRFCFHITYPLTSIKTFQRKIEYYLELSSFLCNHPKITKYNCRNTHLFITITIILRISKISNVSL